MQGCDLDNHVTRIQKEKSIDVSLEISLRLATSLVWIPWRLPRTLSCYGAKPMSIRWAELREENSTHWSLFLLVETLAQAASHWQETDAYSRIWPLASISLTWLDVKRPARQEAINSCDYLVDLLLQLRHRSRVLQQEIDYCANGRGRCFSATKNIGSCHWTPGISCLVHEWASA